MFDILVITQPFVWILMKITNLQNNLFYFPTVAENYLFIFALSVYIYNQQHVIALRLLHNAS